MSEDRLNRIEGKLDKLAEAIVALARMEERMITLFRRMDTYEDGHSSVTVRIDALERSSQSRGQLLAFAERMFWIVATASVGAVFLYLKEI